MKLTINEGVLMCAADRTSNTDNFILELQLTENLLFGYAYDSGIHSLRQANAGSHEFLLNFQLIKNKNGVVSPRYF